MTRTIFSTLISKIIAAALSLAIVMLTTHILGPTGRGEISLITADIGFILLCSQLVGGASLVYLYSRSHPFQLLVASILWSILAPLLLLPFMNWLGLIEHDYLEHLIVICILFGISSSFQMVVLGAKKILSYNIATFLQTLLVFISLLVLFFGFHFQTTFSFVIGLYVAHCLTLLVAGTMCFSLLHNFSLIGFANTLKEAIVRGVTVQFSNIVQFFNYRLSYFFLSSHLAQLGIFSISLVLAEAIWLIGNSISLVHFTTVSNEQNRKDSIKQSFIYAKVSFWATGTCVLTLALFPASGYALVFGERFAASKMATLALCPGILAIGVGMIFSHYFSGTGRFKINNIANLVALSVKIPACILLVPRYQEIGAGLACTLSYITCFLFLYVRFRKETGFGLKDFMIRQDEWQMLKSRISIKSTI